MRSLFLFVLLFISSLSFLSFTIDNREANEDGLINPMLFLRHIFKAWAQNINKTENVIWKAYMKDVRATYGQKNATRIKTISRKALELFTELPTSLQNKTKQIFEDFKNGRIPLTRDSINNIIPKLLASIQGKDFIQFATIKSKVESEFLPLASQVFFNPFDQINNEKLNSTDVDEIGLFTGR